MAASLIKPLTPADVRDRIAKAPQSERASLIEIAWSCYDMGLTGGLAGQSRLLNPFETMLTPADRVVVKSRGKR